MNRERQDLDSRLLGRIGTVFAGPNICSNFQVRESLHEHIQDAMAELAFAKLTNLVWNGNPFRGCGPAGEDVYVQSIEGNEAEQLVINTQYRESTIVVLAVVDDTTVWFIGWLRVSEARKKEWIANNNDTYKVAADCLRPMKHLINELQVPKK